MASKKKFANKIHPHLWYNDKAREAAEFYCSIFPDSRIDRISSLPSDSPSGPAGSVEIVEFIPASLQEMMVDSDREKAKRVSDRMLQMEKFDFAELQAAYDGERVGTSGKK